MQQNTDYTESHRYNRAFGTSLPHTMLSLIRSDVDLAPLTTLGVHCRAAYLAAPDSPADVLEALRWAVARNLPVYVIGAGSNTVFTADFAGLIVQPALRGRAKVGETATHHLIRIGAGENWHDIVAWTLKQGWPGLENLALIPGNVGAAPVQNIGAYGLELADRFDSLEALNPVTGKRVTLSASDCRFGYRDSIFKHPEGRDLIVTAVTLALPRVWQPVTAYRDIADALAAQGIATPSPRAIFDAVITIRQRKLPDPVEIGNVGSFFKNPVVTPAHYAAIRQTHPEVVAYPQADGRFKLAAGWLIDRCGWKGRALGKARVHPAQALVLTNTGGASGQDIMALAKAIRDNVQQEFNVWLEAEPLIVGPNPLASPA